MNQFQKNIALVLTVLLVFLLVWQLFNQQKSPAKEINYTEMLSHLNNGEIMEVTIQGDAITGKLASGNIFKAYAPKDDELIKMFRAKNIKITAKPLEENPWYMIFISWFPMLLLIGVWIFFMRQMQSGGGKAMSFGKSRARLITDKSKKVTFADVAGINEAKAELEEVIDFLKDPKKYTKLGGRIPKGLLLVGPPGTGKTLLARAITSILPPLSLEEALEVTKIYSISDMLPSDTPLMRERPFRSPHHTISHAGLVGGGNMPHPGEISLAHRGVLFLDELPEFGQRILEVLRQPIEDKRVTISRANGTLTFPANFMLIGAMNPCPCGYYGDTQKQCTCSPSAITTYQKRISGPLLDRIDMLLHVPRVEYQKLSSARLGESSADIRQRVVKARERQAKRFAGTELFSNADMTPGEVRQYCVLDAASQALMQLAMRQMQLTARGYHRVLKLARTIADLADCEAITQVHLAEALQYRTKEFEF